MFTSRTHVGAGGAGPRGVCLEDSVAAHGLCFCVTQDTSCLCCHGSREPRPDQKRKAPSPSPQPPPCPRHGEDLDPGPGGGGGVGGVSFSGLFRDTGTIFSVVMTEKAGGCLLSPKEVKVNRNTNKNDFSATTSTPGNATSSFAVPYRLC